MEYSNSETFNSGIFKITKEGEELIESLKAQLSDREFLRDKIFSIIFMDNRLIIPHEFFRRIISLFKKLFKDNDKIKNQAEKIGVRYSTILFVAAVFAFQKGIELNLIYESNNK